MITFQGNLKTEPPVKQEPNILDGAFLTCSSKDFSKNKGYFLRLLGSDNSFL